MEEDRRLEPAVERKRRFERNGSAFAFAGFTNTIGETIA
jgi:hypothetical protein